MALPFQTVEGAGPSRQGADESAKGRVAPSRTADLTLEVLMRQALEVPGAASALLEAYAAQSRALRMVQEADARGAATLPSELRQRLELVASRAPSWLAVDGEGVRA